MERARPPHLATQEPAAADKLPDALGPLHQGYDIGLRHAKAHHHTTRLLDINCQHTQPLDSSWHRTKKV